MSTAENAAQLTLSEIYDQLPREYQEKLLQEIADFLVERDQLEGGES